MAQEIDGLATQVVLDERITPQRIEKLHYNILKGAEDVLCYKFPSTSFSNSQVSFNITSPNLQSCLDRKIILSLQCSFTITTSGRTSGNGPIFTAGTWSPNNILSSGPPYSVSQSLLPLGSIAALRSDCPFQKRCTNVSLQINTQSISYSMFDIAEILLRYGNNYEYANRSLSSLGFKDNYQDYNIANTSNVNNNPLGGYGQQGNAFSGRGVAFTSLTVTNGTIPGIDINNGSIVTIGWDEPLYFPPFIQSLNDVEGLQGLEKLSIQFTTSGLADMLSIDKYKIAGGGDPTTNPVNVTATLIGSPINTQPTLTTFWLYSSASAEQYFLKNRYPITLFNQYITSVPSTSSLAGASNQSIQTQAVTLPSIPSNIWVAVQESKNYKTLNYNATDTFAPISNITLTLGVRSGLLAESFPESLYQMSVRNGLKISFFEFQSNVGSPVCINLAKDLPLLKNLSVGSQERINLSMKITFSNPKTYNAQYEAIILTGDEGILELEHGAARLLSSLVTSKDVVESAIETGNVDTIRVDNNENVGGINLGQNLQHYARNVYNVGRKAYDLYDKHRVPINNAIAKYGPTIAELARQYVASGYSHEDAMRKARKEYKARGLSRGKGLVAGSQIKGNDRRLTSGLDGRD